jgi:thioredoxin-like negative regulator of GroEL
MIEVKKFWREACNPCKTLSPIIERIMNEYPDIKFVSINTDEDKINGGEQISKYGLRSVPTVVFEKDGIEVSRFVGMKSEKEIKDIINTL